MSCWSLHRAETPARSTGALTARIYHLMTLLRLTRLGSARIVALAFATCLALPACGGGGEPTSLDNETRLFVHSKAISLLVGDTVTVGATRYSSTGIVGTRAAGIDSDRLLPEGSLQWRVRDSSIVTVAANGALQARREGSTYLVLTDGQLTDSTTVTVVGANVFRAFTAIKVGGAHACAIDTDRALWCWGGSWSGELGTGERLRLAHYLSPQRMSLPEPISDVAVGSSHTCALGVSGSVFCTGDNLDGQIPGTSDLKVLRFRSVALAVRLMSIDAAGSETCGVTTTGAVFCWGGYVMRTGLTFAPPAGASFTALSVASPHRCALTDQAQQFCWGSQGGSNGTTPPLPTLIATPAPISAVSTASSDVCVIDVAGAVYCWPPGSRREVTADLRIAGLPPVMAISSQGATRCALSAEGQALCWGFDLHGALGRGGSYNINQSTSDLTFPVPAPVSTTQRFVKLAGGGGAFCGLTTVGRAYCWGNNWNGLLGNGVRRRLFAGITAAFSPVPVAVR